MMRVLLLGFALLLALRPAGAEPIPDTPFWQDVSVRRSASSRR